MPNRPITQRTRLAFEEQMGIKGGKGTVYVSMEKLRRARKAAPACNWSVADWRQTLIDLQEQGKLTVAGAAPTGTDWKKRAAGAVGTKTDRAEQIICSIWEWSCKEASKEGGSKMVIRGGQTHRIIDLQSSATKSAKQIRAALAIMAYRGEAHVEMNVYGQRGTTVNRVREIATCLIQEGWAQTRQAWSMAKSVHLHPEKSWTILEMGSGWEGATDGMRRAEGVQRVVTRDCASHEVGPKGEVFPEVWGYFEEEPVGRLIHNTIKKAGVRSKDVIGVWMSLSCKEHSTANGLGAGTGTGKGWYAGKEMSPAEKEGMIAAVIGVWEWHLEDPTRHHFLMENVGWGSMRFEEEVLKRMGEGQVLNGCAYGLKHMKPYRYWTSIPSDVWAPKAAEEYCPACMQQPKGKHEEVMCPKPGDNRPRPRLKGFSAKAARNRVPPSWAQEIAEAFVKMRRMIG